jgi:peptide/nickel transport system permease protein
MIELHRLAMNEVARNVGGRLAEVGGRAELGNGERATTLQDDPTAGTGPAGQAGRPAAGTASNPALRYVVRRTMLSVPVLLGVVIVTFLLLRLIPGDPAVFILGPHATAAQLEALRRQLGLTEPIWTQFWHYLDGLFHGDLGTSIYYQAPVASLVGQRLALTASLVVVATFFSIVITVPLAAHAATHQDRVSDHAIRLFSLAGLGLPSFWLGVILIIFFSVDLQWFPVGGYGTTFWQHLHSLVLPGLCAAFAIVPVLIRSLRVGMLEVLRADFVATARAKGLRPSRVTFVHVARNALIPTVTLLGVNIAYLIGGTVVIEKVFDLNGLGNLMLDAIGFRDFPVVQGIALVYALGVVVVIFLTDLLTARLDPRIRLR